MSARTVSRPLRLIFLRQKRAFNTQHPKCSPEVIPGTSTKSSRSLDASKIFQAQSKAENNATADLKGSANRDEKKPPTYTILETCPDPECPCAEMPAMPEGLPIDTGSKMAGMMPYYDRHVVTTLPATWAKSTTSILPPSLDLSSSSEPLGSHAAALGWPSKIESDPGDLVTILKSHLGPKGGAYRPDFAVSVTAGTVQSQSPMVPDAFEEVLVFPDFVRLRVQHVPSSSSMYNLDSPPSAVPPVSIDIPTLAKIVASETSIQEACVSYSSITKPVVLICGHAKRDARCGILGPLLLAEFRRVLDSAQENVHLGLVSHIGGHKFAGNVVVYMPPNEEQGERYRGHYGVDNRAHKTGSTPIDGHAVWYGRVEPKHVEGIVNQTIKGGAVIKELLRGVHDFGGAIYR